MEHGDSWVVARERCPKCEDNGRDNSGDNLAVYNDGHVHCYACDYHRNADGDRNVTSERPPADFKVIHGKYMDIPERRLEAATCRRYGYEVIETEDKGDIHVNSYFDKNGKVIAQKFRQQETKDFRWRGAANQAGLFGQHLFESGKKITITEGEIDAMSVYQANGGWPVVSLNGGVGNVEKNIKDNLEWLCRFQEVIIMFDNDEPGREAASKAAALLPPGKAKIATLKWKDANECLINNDSKSIVESTFSAKLYSPDEIVHVSEIDVDDVDADQKVWDFPWEDLTDTLCGHRSKEMTMWVSGTGSGKSTIMRELVMHHLQAGRKVGVIMLEESIAETKLDLMSLMINAPIRQIRSREKLNKLRASQGKEPKSSYSYEECDYEAAKATLDAMPLHLYDHFGNSAYNNVLARMEFLAVSVGVDVIVLDHITALAVGLMDSKGQGGDNTTQMIDDTMRKLSSLTQRTGVHLDIVSQLKKTQKSFEEGDDICNEDLRGSQSLTSVPHSVIALVRNRQDNDRFQANCTAVKVLKNRLDGNCGYMTGLYYDHTTGRMEEVRHERIEQDDGSYKNIFKRKG